MLQKEKETIEINSVYGLCLVVLVPIASCWTKCFFSIASLWPMLHDVHLLRAKVFDAVEQMSLQPEMGDMRRWTRFVPLSQRSEICPRGIGT